MKGTENDREKGTRRKSRSHSKSRSPGSKRKAVRQSRSSSSSESSSGSSHTSSRSSGSSSSRSSSSGRRPVQKVKPPKKIVAARFSRDKRKRLRSRSDEGRRSRSKERKRSRSKDRRHSPLVKAKKRSLSQEWKRSRSKEKKRSRSVRVKKRSMSKERKVSRSKDRKRSLSKDKRRSPSRERRRSRSKEKKCPKSKERKRSRSITPKYTGKSSKNDKFSAKLTTKNEPKQQALNHKTSRSTAADHGSSKVTDHEKKKDHRSHKESRLRSRSHSKDRDRRRGSQSRSRERRYRRSRSREKYSRHRSNSRERDHRKRGGITSSKIITPVVSAPSKTAVDIPTEKPSSLPLSTGASLVGQMTPQMAVQQAMAAMNARAQQLTGIALPKYYNPAAVNPLKYAEQMQKRKLLWSKKETKAEVPPASTNNWESTVFMQDQDGKLTAKFRKLMGIKNEDGSMSAPQDPEPNSSEAAAPGEPQTIDQLRKQEELFRTLDQQYEVARMSTHTHRGVGLGFTSQAHHLFPK